MTTEIEGLIILVAVICLPIYDALFAGATNAQKRLDAAKDELIKGMAKTLLLFHMMMFSKEVFDESWDYSTLKGCQLVVSGQITKFSGVTPERFEYHKYALTAYHQLAGGWWVSPERFVEDEN